MALPPDAAFRPGGPPAPDLSTAGVIGVGVDLVDVARFARVLARRPTISGRLFTPGERAYAGKLANPASSLAARFAAKEAVMKALGVGIGAFRFVDVDVQRLPSGEPRLALSGRAAELASQRGTRRWLLSLTHTEAIAAAVALALA
ncbi:MAG TPA: holo-ACP synthase [Acidimicrobiales bacterium]|nr:holo-ACP synthase [Acidimicrobiales bacterium]